MFRLPGAADVVILVRGASAWHLDRADGERWLPLADPPIATAGILLTSSQVAALTARVGLPV